MSKPTDNLVLLGVITGAQGVRGEVKIRSYTENPGDIAAYGLLQDKAGESKFDIKSVRVTKKAVIAKLNGVNDRSAAEALKGAELYVSRELLPPPDDDEWYHADLIGLAIVTPAGEVVGKVKAVHNFGAGDILELDLTGETATILLPFNKQHVPDVDLENGCLTVKPPSPTTEDDENA